MCACLARRYDDAIAYAREGLSVFRGARLYFVIDLGRLSQTCSRYAPNHGTPPD